MVAYRYRLSVRIPVSWAMKPGVREYSRSTETRCPGFVIGCVANLFLCVLNHHCLRVTRSKRHAAQAGVLVCW